MTIHVEVRDLPETTTAVVRGRASGAGIADFLGKAFGNVMATLDLRGIRVVGPPFARYQPAGEQSFDIEAGFPVDRSPEPEGDVEPGVLPGGPVAQVLHVGAYGDIGPVYGALTQWLAERGEAPSGAGWETYLDEPDVAAPRTLISVPYAARQVG